MSKSNSYDVCILGAGPAALTCVSAIREPYFVDHLTETQVQRASELHHKHHRKLRVCVIDPSAQWLDTWKGNFATLHIQHLRSPALGHPNMFESEALLAYACQNNRDENELYKSNCSCAKELNGLGVETQVGLWDLPSTSLFTDFCDDLSKSLQHTYLQGSATDLKSGKNNAYQLEYVDPSGTEHSISARRIILATGMRGKPVVPRGLVTCPTVPWNSPQAFVSSTKSEQKHILVIGGGLTAVQTALRVIEDGHTCVLCSRRPLQEKHFDIPIEWFDRRTTNRCLSEFYHNTIENRLKLLKETRDGGSIPEMYLERLERSKEKLKSWVGDVKHNDCEECKDGKISIQFNGRSHLFDKVILATGISPDCTACPFYKNILKNFPIDVHGGLPNVTQDLRWSEGSNIFVTGAMAALQVGPDAGNLMGMRRAATTISGALECRRWLRKTVLANPYEALLMGDDSDSDSEDECSLCEEL